MGSCLSAEQGKTQSSMLSSSTSTSSRRFKNRLSNSFFRSYGSPTLDSKRDEWLQGIPGRMFNNDSSECASLFTKQGKKGVNQDSMIVWENFGLNEDTTFCGIFDGHGPYGHLVSRRVRDSLPLKVLAYWDQISENEYIKENTMDILMRIKSSEENLYLDDECDSPIAHSVNFNERGSNYSEFFKILKEAFLRASRSMDKELKNHPYIDSHYSGTTAVILAIQDKNLIMGNIGDSRAVLGTRDENGSLKAIQMTLDFKPLIKYEVERIIRCRGRVFAVPDEPEVYRVWLPDDDFPGLAMTRAFGDFCLKDYGLISQPELTYRKLSVRDEFIVLASDGIWDVLSNEKVVDIVASSPNQSCAARCVVDLALRFWRVKYPTSRTDDCAVICLFFNVDSPTVVSSTASSLENEDIETSATDVSDITENETQIASHDWSSLQGMSRATTMLKLPMLDIPPR